MKKKSVSKFIALSLSASIIFANTLTAYADETASTFKDVSSNRWSAPYIESFYEKGYISGYPDGTFKPKEFITRAEVSAIFAKVGIAETKEGLEFIDVSPNEWYYDEINTITKIGLATGYPDGTFKPNNLLTRNEAFKVAATTFKNTDVSSINPNFADQDSVAEWAEIYEKHLMYYDVLAGFPDNTVKGDATITREEFIKLLYHIIYDENISETISENVASWDSYYEQISKDEQNVPPTAEVVPPVVTPSPSEKPSTNGGGSSDSSDDSSDNTTKISKTPLISTIISGDKTVSGTGISGSTITVTMPNGKTYTATVGADNKWSVSIAENLVKNDVVKATQTESGKTVSATVSTTVSDKPISAKPVINTVIEGDKTITGTGIAGAEITVTMPNGKTYTAIVGTDKKWTITITENLLKDDVVKAAQTENGKITGELVSTDVKELILLDTTRASLKEGDPLGPDTSNTKTGATYPHYGTDKPVFDDEIIITLSDRYLDATVEYYKLTTADTTDYTVTNLPSGSSTPLSLTDGEGRITGLSNGDKYVIVSTGTHNGEQKSLLSTIVINNIRDGSKENPFAVSTATELKDIESNLSANYEQLDDIDLENVSWSSIENKFTGSYYGNNNKIENLNGTAGLFIEMNNATVDGINLEVDDITAVAPPFGALCNTSVGSKFSNIVVTINGNITADGTFSTYTGGVFGAFPNSTAENIIVNINGNISSTQNEVGGFAGLAVNATLKNITVNIAEGSSIICKGNAPDGDGENAGGLCAVATNSTASNIRVNNNGHIAAANRVGGAFGTFTGNSSIIGDEGVMVINSSTSLIESRNYYNSVYKPNVGGFAGYCEYANISNINVTNEGNIIGFVNVGGIFGLINGSTIQNHSYSSSDNTIEMTSGGTNIGNYYGVNTGSTFTPAVTTEMNTVVTQ